MLKLGGAAQILTRGIGMFYERYVSLCTREKISPSTAAVKAGFNKGTVSVWKKKYEAGQDVVPEQEIIDKICAFFGCSESWLRGIEKAPTQEGEHEISFDDFTYAFYEESKDLPEEKKKMLLDMARFMKADLEKEKG